MILLGILGYIVTAVVWTYILLVWEVKISGRTKEEILRYSIETLGIVSSLWPISIPILGCIVIVYGLVAGTWNFLDRILGRYLK